jgi:hypothetical protein
MQCFVLKRRLGIPFSYGPIFDEKLTVAAWKAKPCWAIISAKDRMLPPAMEESAAKRMGAVTTAVPTCQMVIRRGPAKVAAVIDKAARNALANRKTASATYFVRSRPEASLLEMHSRREARYT